MILITNFICGVETNMQAVRVSRGHKPDFLIIDSIQTIISRDFLAFKVLYLRFVKSLLNYDCQTNNIATFIAGHVTKEGQLVTTLLEITWVDTVLYLRGNVTYLYFTSSQNRFGLNQ